MENKWIHRICGAATALAAVASSGFAKDFTLADLEKMVREFEAVSPRNSAYKYPIKCNIINENVMNAHATYERAKAGEKPQALMEVYVGLIKEANNDERIIRAVVAHEVAHLAKGHVKGTSFRARDLEHFWVRQIEHEADVFGAELLMKTGRPKQDMIDMLGFLDARRARKGDWLQRLTSDHATPKARMAKIADDPRILKSLVQFDVGLVYMESRSYNLAAEMFETAAQMEPKLLEAWTNRAQSKLLNYWEGLPGAVTARLFRPDFGPFILTPEPIARGNDITPENRAMYREAIAALDEAVAKRGSVRDRELLALAMVLEPDQDRTTVQKGLDALAALKPTDSQMKFRIANNQTVGHLILGDPSRAFTLLINEWRTNRVDNAAGSENLGRFRSPKGARTQADLKLTQSLLKDWLERTPRNSPSYNTVYEGYSLTCGELNEAPATLKDAPTFLQPAVSILHRGRNLGLLFGLDRYVAAYGKPQLAVSILESYPDIQRVIWEDGNYALVCEKDAAMRVTSYVVGDSFTIKAADSTVRKDYAVRVGDKIEDVAWFNLKGGYVREMLGRKGLESWNMHPGLNFGVLIENGKVGGITVSAYAPQEEGE